MRRAKRYRIGVYLNEAFIGSIDGSGGLPDGEWSVDVIDKWAYNKALLGINIALSDATIGSETVEILEKILNELGEIDD